MIAKIVEVIMTDDGNRNTYHTPDGKLLFQVPDPNVTEINKIVKHLTQNHADLLVKGESVGDAVVRIMCELARRLDVAERSVPNDKPEDQQ